MRENKRIKMSFRKLKRNQDGEELRQEHLLGHAVVKDKRLCQCLRQGHAWCLGCAPCNMCDCGMENQTLMYFHMRFL